MPLRLLSGMLLWVIPAAVTIRTAVAADRLNVLLIMADDLRPELAGYGSPAITRHLDRLAARGVQFNRAYCQQAVCNPSRSSMLTGRRPDTLRLWNNGTHFRELNPDATTLPLWVTNLGNEAWGTEFYRLVQGQPAGERDADGRETDLFAGID